jgi:hypothetical protein
MYVSDLFLTCGACQQTNLDVAFLFMHRKEFPADLPAEVQAELTQYAAAAAAGTKENETRTFAAKSWCGNSDCTVNDNVPDTLHVKCAKDLGYDVMSCDFGYSFACECPC